MNLRIGPSLVVIAIGAIFAFAVTPHAIPGINVNVAGIIVLLVGIIALVLAVRSGGAGRLQSLSPWLRPSGHDNPRVDEEKRAAAADDAAIMEDDRYFDPSGPGRREDDL
ncbi:MAG TPA: hypothetical protein VGJ19_06170 [Streptosporangiaceae bacterium]|jgi:hypothetical protein